MNQSPMPARLGAALPTLKVTVAGRPSVCPKASRRESATVTR
jgi:hypothetical protein